MREREREWEREREREGQGQGQREMETASEAGRDARKPANHFGAAGPYQEYHKGSETLPSDLRCPT